MNLQRRGRPFLTCSAAAGSGALPGPGTKNFLEKEDEGDYFSPAIVASKVKGEELFEGDAPPAVALRRRRSS